MTKLDKTSKRVLFALDSNARQSLNGIAKRLSLPEATVRYRVRALEEEGVIQQAYPVFGAGRVGMSVHKFMFRLHKASENEITKLSTHLVQHARVNWVARFDGNFDLGCTLLVTHVGDVSRFLDEVRRTFHAQVKLLAYAVNLHAEFFPRDYLVREKRPAGGGASYFSYADKGETVSMDTIDRSILQALADDARMGMTAVAERAKVTLDTATRRLRRLEKNGVITGYRIAVDHHQLQRTSYYLLLYLNFVSAERLEAMLAYLRTNAAVVYIIKMLGEWDYDVSIELENQAAYRTFMTELLKRFSDVIKDSHTLTTWQVEKFSILPASTGATDRK